MLQAQRNNPKSSSRHEGSPLPGQLDTARKALEKQLGSLRQELQRLEAAHAALDEKEQRRGSARPRASRRASDGRTGARRRRSSSRPTRADQAHELVRANPGITIPELAKQMGINDNYLYRVLPTLKKERKVTKRGKGWHATARS